MDRDILRGRWAEISWDMQRRRAHLRADELDDVNGDPEKFLALLKKEYACSSRLAAERYSDFMSRYLGEGEEEGIPRA
jgi:hypothetical protein